MARPLIPPASPRLHNQTRHRVLELEKRLRDRPPPFDLMVCANYPATTMAAGSSGRWYVVQTGCILVGLVVTLMVPGSSTTTTTVKVNGVTLITATLVADAGQVHAAPAEPEHLGPDDYLTFHTDGAGTGAGLLTMQALLTGPSAYSGGLLIYADTVPE